MKFLLTIALFVGLLVSLYFLEADQTNYFEAKTTQENKKIPSQNLKQSEAKRGLSSENTPIVKDSEVTVLNSTNENDSLISVEFDPKSTFLQRSRHYYLNQAHIIQSWEKTDQQGNQKTKVVLFEPLKKTKYGLLRMEQQQGNRITEENPQFMVADHVMVTLNDQASIEEFESLMVEVGARIRRLQPRSQVFLVEFNGEQKGEFERVLAELNRRRDLVKYAEPDYLVSNL